jgi:Ser/Thr protein kinase RdoA (MazF antagonist)
MTDLFLNLTPDWVLAAVERGGFEPTGHIMALHCLENRVYDLKLEDESHIVVKFYRPGRWSRATVQEEHDLLFDLAEAEVPVCAPLRFEDGESIHEVEGILYAVWPRTGGRSQQELTDDEVERLGRLVARLHNVAALKPFQHRRVLNGTTYGREPLALLSQGGFLPPHIEGRYARVVERVADLYDELAKKVPTHRIHGDCHHGNLLSGRAGWFFLDFDDALTGPAVQDIWLLVPDQDEHGQQQRRLFIDAYQTFRKFDPAWLKLVEPLRALRYIHYAAWIARRWKDPAFPSAFPHFNTEEYWNRETRDLEEQLARAEEIALRGY